MKTTLLKSLRLLDSPKHAFLPVLLAALAVTSCATGPTTPAPTSPNPPTATLPYRFDLAEVPNSTLPAVHSYSSAHANGKWLIIGGRIAGLHGFGNSTNNFPRSTANLTAYVIDLAANRVLGSANLVQSLPAQLAGPLTASNPEFVQVGTNLFIVGGYGKDLVSGELTTFGSLIKVDVRGLIQAITNNAPITNYFVQNPASDNRLKVTGGSLKSHKGIFYLVFGQDFTGIYSVQNRDYNRAGGQFQKYTEKVRMFTLNSDLSIQNFNQIDGGYDSNLPYHRRDLNVVDIIQPNGAPAATVYGGVFRAGQVAGHTTPIDIDFGSSFTNAIVTHRTNFNQALNHYDCASVTVFDSTSASCFTTLMGGISQYHYNSQSNMLVQDQVNLPNGVDGLPFIKNVSIIQHGAAGSFAQYIQPTTMPGLLGTDAQFLYSTNVQSGGNMFENGVINLAKLQGTTLVGYVYGGIESFGPYTGLVTNNPSSKASSRLFEVYITPTASKVLQMPPLPTQTTPYPPTP